MIYAQHNAPHILKLLLLSLLFTSSLLPAKAQPSQKITIAVASSLTPPFQKIEQVFEQQYPEIQFTMITASSGKLTAQILNGAPYDIFISADMHYPKQVDEQHHAKEKPLVLMQGRLVFWSKTKTTESRIADLLTSNNVKTIAIAQPELAPYGQKAKNWLNEHHIYDRLSDKMVFGESINQVNQYIKSGAVEAAFTAISAMYAPSLKDVGYWLPLEVATGDPHNLDQGLVVLTNGESDDKTIDLFLKFLNSPAARNIFSNFGYQLP